MIIQHLKGIKKVILPVFENDFWRIRLEVFKNNLEVWQTISTLRKIVQENDDLIIYHRPTPFSFNKEDKDFEVIIENTSKLIRPKEVIDKIINDIEEISIDEEFSAEHIAIEGQFLFTWDEIEIFYRFSFLDEHCDWKKTAISFIKKLRRLGFDRKFRAGQQLSTFILSRCLRHGMNRETNHLRFIFLNENEMEVEVRNNGLEIQKKIYTIGVNEELIAILEEMASENN